MIRMIGIILLCKSGLYSHQEANIDYDSMPEYLNYDFSSLTKILQVSFSGQVYGAPLEVNEGKARMILILFSPNTEYEDANNDKICGAIHYMNYRYG